MLLPSKITTLIGEKPIIYHEGPNGSHLGPQTIITFSDFSLSLNVTNAELWPKSRSAG